MTKRKRNERSRSITLGALAERQSLTFLMKENRKKTEDSLSVFRAPERRGLSGQAGSACGGLGATLPL